VRLHRALSLAVTSWLAGCEPTTTTSPTDGGAAMASVAPSATPTAPATACARFDADHRALLTRLREGAPADVIRTLDALPAIFGRCLPDARGSGAWGVRVAELCATPPSLFPDAGDRPPVLGRWTVVRMDGANVTTFPVVNPPSDPMVCATEPNLDHLVDVNLLGTPAQIAALRFEEPVVFDHDGDGRAELMLRVQGQRAAYTERGKFERWDDHHGMFLAADASARVTEAPGARFRSATVPAVFFEGAARVDGDERPDAYSLYPYGDVLPVPWEGPLPRVYARSLPDGTFSIDDPAAVARTLEGCPPATDPVVVPASGAVDGDGTLARVLCIALRSGLEAARTALDRDCKGRDRAACRAVAAQVDVSRHVPQLGAR
jgi:hypothetical protein